MILKRIADSTRLRTEQKKLRIPFDAIKKTAQHMNSDTGFPFEKALKRPGMNFICEIKKASPSKGLISPDFPYIAIAREYEEAGAAAISGLTEPEFFLGSDEYLNEIQKRVSVPVLRKDFTLDAYQIYEAKILGASAVLLICSLLDTDTIREYIAVCDNLGISALAEAHNGGEIESALDAGARIIGVNNRNLNDFSVDIKNCITLRKLVPPDILFVAESGIQTSQDIEMLRQADVNGVLIGEILMRCEDKRKMLRKLMGEVI
jgi:indole-3-glycerol phosphate synthase